MHDKYFHKYIFSFATYYNFVNSMCEFNFNSNSKQFNLKSELNSIQEFYFFVLQPFNEKMLLKKLGVF